jgi:hypothetical protein
MDEKTANEKVRLIFQFGYKDAVYHIIGEMLTKNKFQIFFYQTIQVGK